ncbi:MAG: FG-GAP-like repeat-containing protein [Alphaproteobacteria bacterium]
MSSASDNQNLIGLTSSASAGAEAIIDSVANGPLSKVDSQLAALHLGHSTMALAAQSFTSTVQQFAQSVSPDGRYVLIDATAADGSGAFLLDQLEGIGLLDGSSFGAVASGGLPIDEIEALGGLGDLNFARESPLISNVGAVTTQADASLHSNSARSTFAVNGAGVKVGILSDSFNSKGGYSADIATGDLPSGIQVLQDNGTTDEGRGMAQLIYDIAPGASLAFATANGGQAGLANNIIALKNAGAKVIVDDVIYFAEPMFQDGIVAQAVNQVVTGGAVYFSSAGNNGHKGYEAPFLADGSQTINGKTETWHDYNAGGSANIFMPFTLANNSRATIVLQWNQPAASVSPGHGATSDLDLFVTDNSVSHSLVSSSQTNNVGNDPIEIVQVTNTTGAAQTYDIVVGLASGVAPTDMKIVTFNGNGSVGNGFSSNTNDGTIYGHAAATGAIAVGAASYARTPAFGSNPPVVESFSSAGPTRIFFDTAGNPIFESRQTPQITAPDGGNTSFFGSDDNDADSFPNFFGTSAAAPAAAAVAALLLQANGSLDAAAIKTLLMNSTIDMDNPATGGFDSGFDVGTGAGLIQADRALSTLANSVSINDVSISEGDSGTKQLVFTVTRIGSADALSVNYATADGTATTADSDYVAKSGTLSFASGATTQTISVTINGDTKFETNETFSVVLSGATNGAIISGNTGIGTINNDDAFALPRWLASVDTGPHPAGWLPAATGDYNSDGTSDLLWFNAATRNLDLWKIQNGNWAGSVDVGTHSAGYVPSASGDFNGDGTSDVLWYSPGNGDVDIWKIANGQLAGSASVGPHPLGWQPAGSGDFNNDGTSDVLWYNSANGDAEVWKLSNAQWAGSVDIGPHPLGWQLIGTGDFDHDGTSDVLWYDPTTRDIDLWKISNSHWAGSVDMGTHPAGYAPAGIGDFNGDGTPDLAWFNPSNGDPDIWLIVNGHWAASKDIGVHPLGWSPAGIGDFDHNGISDVLWREPGTNRIDTWLLSTS